MLDACELERLGKPTVTIAQDRFELAAKIHDRLGLPHLPLVIERAAAHGNIPPDAADVATGAVTTVLAALCSDAGLMEVRESSDYWEWYALAVGNGWTDGLPLPPRTERVVRAIVDPLGGDPEELIGHVPPLMGEATVESVAVQSAMAGCLPEHVPVVVAALRAMLRPEFNLHGVQFTTNPCAPLAIVSGEIVGRLGFSGRDGCLGGGSRANATVGRAIRLVLWNLGGARPGDVDMATIGMSGKYGFCVGEDASALGWASFHADYGIEPDASVVTVFACQSPDPVLVPGDARRILAVLAASLPTPGVNMFHAAGQVLIVLSGKRARALVEARFDRQSLRNWVFEHARFEVGALRRSGVLGQGEPHMTYWGHGEEGVPDLDSLPDGAMLPMVRTPEDVHVLVAGGDSQWWAGFCAGWGNYGGYATSERIAA